MSASVNISVIIPYYNDGDKIVRAYNSVLKQTNLPKEIIIVDDASSDKSYLCSLEQNHDRNIGIDLKIVFLGHNQGPSIARNIGVENSTSEYIAFLDADDVWHPQKLEIVSKFLTEDKKMIFHLYSPIIKASEFYNLSDISLNKLSRNLFIYKNFIATPTVVLKKKFFIEFPIDISHCEDYCCWLMNNTNKDFYYIDLPLAHGFKKPIGESGLSGNIAAMHKGFVKALFFLRKEKYISRTFFCMALIFEYAKYPLRFFR